MSINDVHDLTELLAGALLSRAGRARLADALADALDPDGRDPDLTSRLHEALQAAE